VRISVIARRGRARILLYLSFSQVYSATGPPSDDPGILRRAGNRPKGEKLGARLEDDPVAMKIRVLRLRVGVPRRFSSPGIDHP
jgi:hypothetical protein